MADAARKLGDDDVGQGEMGERRGVACNVLLRVGGWAFYEDLRVVLVCCCLAEYFAFVFRWCMTYPLVVDDLDDGGESADERALCENCDTADLDHPPVACRDLCVAHGADI